MIPVDVDVCIGGYPFRYVPHPEPEVLVRVLDREGVASAWVGHLPSAFHRDPSPGNRDLYAALAPHSARLLPAPTIRPDWPRWEHALRDAVERGAPAVRAYPQLWQMGPGHPAMRELADACADAGLVLLLTTRFEDLRQRHWLDAAPDLAGAAVRSLVRDSRACIVLLHSGRELLEEIYWGLTEVERVRLWFDFSWIWGPPEDHLAILFRTIGADRFVFGTGWPLRLTQAPSANLALLPEALRSARIAGGDDIVASARALGGRRSGS